MIPIISISSLTILPLSFLAAWKTHSTYLKTKDKRIGYFSKSFFYTGIMGIFLSLPGLVLKNLRLIDLAYDLYVFFLLLSQAYFLNITFDILNWEKVRKIVFWGMVVAGLIISLVPAFRWSDAVVGYQGPFIFWEDTRGPIINIIMGSLVALASLWFVLFFFWRGLKSIEKFARRRAFLLAIGMTFFILAGIIDYILGATPNIIYISAFTAITGYLAISFFLAAIYWR